MIWDCGFFCSNNNMTYLPWNIPLFQKMIFHFLKREPLLSINHKMQSWEERGILHSKYYLQTRWEAGMWVFVLVWQSVSLRNSKTLDTLLLEKETHWRSCTCFSRLWAIQVQKLCGAFLRRQPHQTPLFYPDLILTFILTLPASLQSPIRGPL